MLVMSSAAVLEAAQRGDAASLVSLLRLPQHANVTDEVGCSALQRAAADGHVDAVKVLLAHGADPTLRDHVHGNTALHEAAWKGYSQTAAILAAHGRDGAEGGALCARNAAGFAPLHLACQAGHNQTARELLLAGAPPDLQNNYGDTSLHTAARYGHAGVTRILISAQCRVSEQNKNGDTALHIAAAMGRRKLTRILLEAGCDKSIKNQQGETARDIAQRKGLEEIINILNTPVAKQRKKKRDKSKEKVIDEPDAPKKDKKKKNVHFEKPPQVQWSPYGCHYYPDPKYFPKPKLSSLPQEPLQKGEQYYLDLAGNIKKGPIGAGYTCYCAPFFKHMEEKLNMDKKDLKKHIDRAHEKIDQKVTDLEMKTQGQLSELTRFVAAERAMCKERHKHLEQWLTRGMMFRQSERVRKLDFSPKGSLDIPPLKRTRSLEILDSHAEEWNRVNKLIQSFNRNTEQYEPQFKNLNESKTTSRSTEMLDNVSRLSSQSSRRNYLKGSKSSDQLDAGSSRCSRSPYNCPSPHKEGQMQNVTAEIHVKSNKVTVTPSVETQESYLSPSRQNVETQERYSSPSRQNIETQERYSSPSRQYNKSSESSRLRIDSEGECIQKKNPPWKSQVLQRTADDIHKRVQIEKEMSDVISRANTMDISQDGYVRLTNQNYGREESCVEREPIKSVQELVAQVEHKQRCQSPELSPLPRKLPMPEPLEPPITPVNLPVAPPHGILKMPQQPLRPAPVLKEKPKTKRFSLQNLIPFPTRKTFQTTPKENGNDSESSDEDDAPIRSTNQPGPMKNANLLQTLPLPNFETVPTNSQPPAPQFNSNSNYVYDLRHMVPKDAYFHEIPNRQHRMPYQDIDNGLPMTHYHPSQYEFVDPNLSQIQAIQPRNRNPLYHNQTGVFDAMMQDHMVREIERIPHCYEHLDQNTEIEIANQNHPYYNNSYRQPMCAKPPPDHSLLHSRLQSLAINTHLTEIQSQADRESHNDSGYSTKVYGSSQGPSPSLSGNVDDNLSGQRVNVLPHGKAVGQIGASSLV